MFHRGLIFCRCLNVIVDSSCTDTRKEVSHDILVESGCEYVAKPMLGNEIRWGTHDCFHGLLKSHLKWQAGLRLHATTTKELPSPNPPNWFFQKLEVISSVGRQWLLPLVAWARWHGIEYVKQTINFFNKISSWQGISRKSSKMNIGTYSNGTTSTEDLRC